ncbi:MAG TPA: hypothetical protein VFQ23_20395, partial [Anaerolineales bacterium]|nr:hypothetical protein [Anaerolineales bacterium]
SRSVEILETFPNVGMVTARPFRTPPEFYESTLKWAQKDAVLEDGQFIPWERFLEFNLSLGQTEEENRKVYAETKDWRITYKGITAMAGASHWQFTAYKSTLQQFLPFEMDKPMGQVRQLDKRMNDAGLLRLMVSDPLAMNMSNTLGYLRGELKGGSKKKRVALGKRVAELSPIKKLLLAIYNRIFKIYYDE